MCHAHTIKTARYTRAATTKAMDNQTEFQCIDAHCHLQDPKLIDDLSAILDKACTAGVAQFVSCGTCPADWDILRALANSHKTIIPFYGVHPWFVPAGDPGIWLQQLEKLVADNPAAGIGEIGLDHAMSERNDELQHKVFELQLDVAIRLNRPAAIHCRKAWGTLLAMLLKRELIPAGFLVHSFSGSCEMMTPILKANGYISFSGSITRRGNKRGHEAAKVVPLDRLLVETDSPDLPPIINGIAPDSYCINTPSNLPVIIAKIAELRNMPAKELTEITYENSKRLFSIHIS